jgi:uncharacterized protein YdeI (YjbR/CyaY-like superfamily)
MEERNIFRNKEEFYDWLYQNHDKSDCVWVVYSKSKDIETIRYDESVEVALCFGWVEILLKRIDELSYMRKFTPRKPNSLWSENNKKLAERLLDEGMMHESGIKAIEGAIKSGNWEKNYRIVITPEQTAAFEKLLQPQNKAINYYSSLSPSHKRQYQMYYYHAKREETRIARFKKIVEMLENRKGFM